MRIGSDGLSASSPSLQGWEGAAQDEATGGFQPLGTRKEDSADKGAAPKDRLELSPEAQQQVTKLKARDQEVRAHEAAHMAAGGALVKGGAAYTYQQGPDGQRYAVGGEVSVDTSAVPDDPEATILKADRIRAAALAPADPSGQDRAVAAQAAAMASKAATELARQKSEAAAPTSERKTVGSTLDVTA